MNKENKKKKVLTIVIPTYNIEKYIEKCLNSFYNDELLKYIEVIIVNDGSTDKSLEIAETFAKKNSSYRIIDKKNGGHGSTINCGIKNCTGNYFMVVDGDDWVDAKSLLSVINFLNKNLVDAVFMNSIIEIQSNNSQRIHSLKNIFKNEGFVDLDKININLFKQIGLSNIIYNAINLKKINLELLEKTYYVDVEYMIYPLITLNKTYYFDTCVYHYLVGRSNQSINVNTALKHVDDRNKVIRQIVSNNTNNSITKSSNFAKKFYYSKMSSVINDYYDILIRGNCDYIAKISDMNNFLLKYDRNLFNYTGKKYLYINFSSKTKSKIIIKYSFYLDRILKKIARVFLNKFTN